MMPTFLMLALLLFLVVGHGAIWVACFNRINATGLHRNAIKVIEKHFILACFLIPILLWWFHGRWVSGILTGKPLLPTPSWWVYGYGVICVASFCWQVPCWLRDRVELLSRPESLVRQITRSWDVRKELATPLFLDSESKLLGEWPFNEVGRLEAAEKHICHPSMPACWMNLRIGHLSDIHLTGKVSLEYYRFALEKFKEFRSDIIFLTGDILDYAHQLDSLECLFGSMDAP